MDDEEISESELTDLIKRFEIELSNNHFDYYAQYQLVALIDYYLDHASYNKAGEAVELAIQQHPYYAGFCAKKAFIHTINEESEEALELVNRALDLDPGNAEFLTQKGSIYELMHQPLLALDLFDEAMENGGSVTDILVLKMFVYYNLSNNELALSMIEQMFSDFIEEDRLIMEAHFCLQLMETYEDGIRIFSSYTDLDPFQEVVWYHLGQLYICNGQYEEAINAFEFSIAIDETYAEPWIERGNCLMEIHKFVEAAASFETFLELDGPDALICTQLGECYRFMELFQKSRTYYRKALKADAKYAPAWHGLGQSFADEGRHLEALPFFQKAVKIHPDDEFVIIDLANTQIQLGQLSDASNILTTMSHDSPTFKPVWHLLAAVEFKLGNIELAIKTLQKGISIAGKDSKSLYKLASYYFILGESRLGYEFLTDGLLTKFDDHYLLYEDAQFLKEVKAVNDIIELYKNDK